MRPPCLPAARRAAGWPHLCGRPAPPSRAAPPPSAAAATPPPLADAPLPNAADGTRLPPAGSPTPRAATVKRPGAPRAARAHSRARGALHPLIRASLCAVSPLPAGLAKSFLLRYPHAASSRQTAQAAAPATAASVQSTTVVGVALPPPVPPSPPQQCRRRRGWGGYRGWRRRPSVAGVNARSQFERPPRAVTAAVVNGAPLRARPCRRGCRRWRRWRRRRRRPRWER